MRHGCGATDLMLSLAAADDILTAGPILPPSAGPRYNSPVMLIIPAIDIRGGRCVRLEQGDYARETVFGDDPAAVAARIAALAEGGEILVANVVRELAEGKGFLFGDRGEVALRGFEDPVRLFEVRWREGD